MDDKGNGNVIKLPRFDGKKRHFALWWSVFEAVCNMKGCAEALDLSFKAVLPVSDSEVLNMATNKGKASKKAKCKARWRKVI